MEERNYETVCIIRPDAGEEVVKGIIERAEQAVRKGSKGPFLVDDWGRRKLAYPIQKKTEGRYVLLTYRTTSQAAREMERMLKLNEDVLRYQTVRLKGDIEESAPAKKEEEEEGGKDE